MLIICASGCVRELVAATESWRPGGSAHVSSRGDLRAIYGKEKVYCSIPQGAPSIEIFTSPSSMFTSGSDSLLTGLGLGFPARLGWPGCGAGEFTAALAGAGLLTAAGAACVFVAGLAGGQGALVAHDHEAGQPEHELGPHQSLAMANPASRFGRPAARQADLSAVSRDRSGEDWIARKVGGNGVVSFLSTPPGLWEAPNDIQDHAARPAAGLGGRGKGLLRGRGARVRLRARRGLRHPFSTAGRRRGDQDRLRNRIRRSTVLPVLQCRRSGNRGHWLRSRSRSARYAPQSAADNRCSHCGVLVSGNAY